MKSPRLNQLLLATALLLAPGLCSAYETDQFTGRLTPVADSTALLDEQVNLAIERAIANWKGPRNDWKVVNTIYEDIGGHHWVDKIERWAWKSEEVEKISTERYDSIYSGHPLWATRWMALFGVGPTIKVNGQLIGSDKLGHFISQGRKFYRRYMKYLDESKAAEHSAYTERALFGQMTNGVYSNADLVANYEGFLFFLSLFEDDVIGGKPAILAWEGDGWTIQRPFTWADHVNEYWDEALNINFYDSLLYKHMEERLAEYCPDYYSAPDLYVIEDEELLMARYQHLELRDTSELRLSQLCAPGESGQTSTGVAAQQK